VPEATGSYEVTSTTGVPVVSRPTDGSDPRQQFAPGLKRVRPGGRTTSSNIPGLSATAPSQGFDRGVHREIRLGVQNCRDTTRDDVMENVAAFLSQGDAWRDQAEPGIVELRRAALRVLPAGPDALAASVALEIEACGLAASARWTEPAAAAQEAARVLGAGSDATRGYRALWLYLAGVWSDEAAAVSGDPRGRQTARALIIRAEQAAKPGTWTRDLAPLPDTEPEALGTADITAVTAVAALLGSGASKGKHDTKVARMLEGLAARESGKYEPALTVLGQLLGAEAGKPPGKGRCDSAWCWDEALWLAVEAKSDHEPTGVVPHKDTSDKPMTNSGSCVTGVSALLRTGGPAGTMTQTGGGVDDRGTQKVLTSIS